MIRIGRSSALILLLVIFTTRGASALTGEGPAISPNTPPAPASAGITNLNNGQLQAGAGGVYTPLPPATIPAGSSDPSTPTTATTTVGPLGCPPGFTIVHDLPTGSGDYIIHPWFSRNASGGYDGHDAWFGYDAPNAVPPGGDPARTDLGAPATADNIAGHIIAVNVAIGPTNRWPNSLPPWGWYGDQPPPGVAGTCDGGAVTYGFSQPHIAGDSPIAPPPTTTLTTPPFGLGAALAAEITGHWRIGTIGTLPGPGTTTRTYVHIPTCSWLDSGVPTSPVHLHAIKTALSNGYTLFLVYDVTVTPGSVTWDWGDDTQTTSTDTPTTAPPALPAYDASTQTWTNPCTVSHSYATVSSGRTITATQTFTTSIRVSWNDGVKTNTQNVTCDPSNHGSCTLTVGPAQGWQSGPHPVDQIEPVPFYPAASA